MLFVCPLFTLDKNTKHMKTYYTNCLRTFLKLRYKLSEARENLLNSAFTVKNSCFQNNYYRNN